MPSKNLKQAQSELNTLVSEIINKQKEVFKLGGKGFAHLGLTDACRLVLLTSDRPLWLLEIRHELIKHGYDPDRHRNLISNIRHTVLRLVDDGFAVQTESRGRPAYLWNEKAPYIKIFRQH